VEWREDMVREELYNMMPTMFDKMGTLLEEHPSAAVTVNCYK